MVSDPSGQKRTYLASVLLAKGSRCNIISTGGFGHNVHVAENSQSKASSQSNASPDPGRSAPSNLVHLLLQATAGWYRRQIGFMERLLLYGDGLGRVSPDLTR